MRSDQYRLGGGWRWVVVVLGLFGLVSTEVGLAQGAFSENEVKAVFLYNFASFVSWPTTPQNDPAQPFQYCVLDDELAPILQKALKGERVAGRALMVQRQVAANLAECQVLYVGKDKLRGSEAWDLVRRASSIQVLTVSDLEGSRQGRDDRPGAPGSPNSSPHQHGRGGKGQAADQRQTAQSRHGGARFQRGELNHAVIVPPTTRSSKR